MPLTDGTLLGHYEIVSAIGAGGMGEVYRAHDYSALAQVCFFQHDFDAFRPAAERAIALNPLDGSTVAFMGILIAYSGDWERGVAVADRAMSLNPHHPGWYRFAA